MGKPSHWRIVPSKHRDGSRNIEICGLCASMDMVRPWCHNHRFKADIRCVQNGQCKDWLPSAALIGSVQNEAIRRELEANPENGRILTLTTPKL